MLSRNNKILIGCLALLLVMSVGYALFSDTITINGTATAKGNFDITATCEVDETDGGNGTCDVDGNTITTQSSLSMPGERTKFTIKITNSGSIPAKLKSLISPNNTNGKSNLVNGNIVFEDGDMQYIDKDTLLGAYYVVRVGDQAIQGDSNVLAAAGSFVLEPGYYFYVDIYHVWGDVALSEYQPKLPEEGASISYDLTLGYEQVTN